MQKTLIDYNNNGYLGFRTTSMTSFANCYPQYGLGSYLDDNVYICTGGWSGSNDVQAYFYTRSGDTYTLSQDNITMGGSASYWGIYSYWPPFKMGSYYCFPVVRVRGDGEDEAYLTQFGIYYSTNGASWSFKTIASTDTSAYGRNYFNINYTPGSSYAYAIHRTNATTLTTYRINTSLSVTTGTTYTIANSTSTAYCAAIAGDGAWVYGGRYYSSTYNGSMSNTGTYNSLGYSYDLYKINGKYWLIGSGSSRIATTIANLANNYTTVSFGGTSVNRLSQCVQPWEYGMYRFQHAATGPILQVATESTVVLLTGTYVDSTSSNHRHSIAAHNGKIDCFKRDYLVTPSGGNVTSYHIYGRIYGNKDISLLPSNFNVFVKS